MTAVFKREFRAYFQNVIGWLAVAVLLAVYGLYFLVYNMLNGYPTIANDLSAISFIMLIIVPLLTMRSFSEDRKTKVEQLLWTSPAPIWKVVLGKYLALVAVFTIDIAIIAVTPVLLCMFGTVALGESYVALFGFWLFGCAMLAIGMFISSLTESQVIAAVITFPVLFILYMMNSFCNLISSSGNLLTKILSVFDLYTPFESFINKIFDLNSILYFVTVVVLMIFLTVQGIQKRRWSMSKSKIGTGVFSTGLIALVLAVAVGANFLLSLAPSTITDLDASYAGLYDITDDTKELVKNLEEDIDIYVYAAESDKDTQVATTLSEYEALSKHVTVTYIDPDESPNFYQTYSDSEPDSNSLIVVSDKRSKIVDYSDLYEVSYSMDYTTYSYTSTTTGYDAEGQITSAIEYVTMDADSLPIIYQVTGHGETSLSDNFTEAIEKANFSIEDLDLMTADSVPEDASMIIIQAPTKDFNEDEAGKVIDYLEAGGKAILVGNYQAGDLPNFESILEAYGVSFVDGVVMENDSNLYYSGTPYYLLPNVSSTSYSSDASGYYIFAPLSVGLSYDADANEDVTYTDILTTSDSAVSKTSTGKITTSEYEDGDIQGPFTIAMAIEKTTEDGDTTQIFVSGSSLLFSDEADEVVSGTNATLFTNVITNMLGESTQSNIVIPVKEVTLGNLTITTLEGIVIGLIFLAVIPIILIIFGIVFWAVRRKK